MDEAAGMREPAAECGRGDRMGVFSVVLNSYPHLYPLCDVPGVTFTLGWEWGTDEWMRWIRSRWGHRRWRIK